MTTLGPDKHAQTSPRWLGLVSVFALFAILICKALFVLHGSVAYGRLSAPPAFDDISYFLDGLNRLHTLQNDGGGALVLEFFQRPPHAPYSSMAAMTAFALFGPDRFWPYLMNAVAIAALLVVLLERVRAKWPVFVVAATVVTATSWYDQTVSTFHPDLVCGFGTAVVTALIAFRQRAMSSRLSAFACGLVAGAVLLIKPVALPMLLVMWGWAWLWVIGTAAVQKQNFKDVLLVLGFWMLGAALVAGLFFSLTLKGIIDYIIAGQITERGTWDKGMTPQQHLMFFKDQAFEIVAWWPVGALLLLAPLLAWRRDDRIALGFVGLLISVAIAYAVPTMAPVKSFFFGGVFYGMTMVATILALWGSYRALTAPEGASRMRRAGAPTFLLAVLCIAAACTKDGQGRFPENVARDAQKEVAEVTPLLLEAQAVSRLDPTSTVTKNGFIVYFPLPAPMAPQVLEFESLRRGHPLSLAMSQHESDPAKLMVEAERASFIVLPSDALTAKLYQYPVNAALPAFRTLLVQSQSFDLVKTIDLRDGPLDVYVRRPLPAPPKQ